MNATGYSKQRISDFQAHANSHAAGIRDAGEKAWRQVTAKGEVEIIREFLVKRGRGTDYLNRNLTPLLSGGGRVVKFASVFLHQMPMVFGLRQPPTPGGLDRLEKRCELGDLQTFFLYLDAPKNICQMRSVIFQAKLEPQTTHHVIDHPQQRELYDRCWGFEYDTVLRSHTRRLPTGHLRERALQYLFVDPQPVRTRTIPSEIGQGAFENYGEHLLRFLNDSTGLNVIPAPIANNTWDRIVWDMIEHVANEVASRGLIRNWGLRALLDHFNAFEDHETFSIDTTDGARLPEGEGYGVQFVIVWDDELGLSEAGIIQGHFHSLLADYLGTLETNPEKRVARKENLAGQMAELMLKNKELRSAVLEAGEKDPTDGLIAALAATAIRDARPAEISRLLTIGQKAYWRHPKYLVVEAILQALRQKRFPRELLQDLYRLVDVYAAARLPVDKAALEILLKEADGLR